MIGEALCMCLEKLGFSEENAVKIAEEASRGKVLPIRRCPALSSDEEECVKGAHKIRGPGNRWRKCRLDLYRSERKRLAAQLALCGYSESTDEVDKPIGPALWASIDLGRTVENLRAELMRVSDYKKRGWDRAGHLALIGSTGVVKSHVLFALYFAALWGGVSAWYLTMAELRQAAKNLDSHNDRVAHDAEYLLQTWQRKRLLVLDDLGDRLTDQRMSREPGSTRAAALLLDLLNGHSGKHMFAANLDSDALAEHPDVGPRAVSRLFGDHRVELKNHAIDIQPCMVVALYGDDQRQYLLMKQAEGIRR